MSWVLVSAGETSGDRIAAPVVRELQGRYPKLRFFGAGGDCLQAAGVEVRHHILRLSVMGLTEAMGRVGSALRLIVDMEQQIHRRRPCLGLLVDYPGLNLRLAALLHRAGIPVLFYVAPQRWAWLHFRTGALRRLIDQLAVILPFEESWFRQRGIHATFVGHPVLDLFAPLPAEQARAELGLGPGPVLALLPGSRFNEIRQHLPLLKVALAHLPAAIQPVLATVPGEGSTLCRALAPDLPCGSAAQVLGAADVALCASGTATLEAAIAGVPTAVFYRLSTLSYRVARHLVRVPKVGLPNLLLGECLLPELIQDKMTPMALASIVKWLLEPQEAARIRVGLARVVLQLGHKGVAERVAALAEDLLGATRYPSNSRFT